MNSTNSPNPVELTEFHEVDLSLPPRPRSSSHATTQLPDSEESSRQASSESVSSNKLLMAQKKRKIRSEVIRDFIIGYADGMTVPFALTAGLSSVASRKTIVAAGLLELVGGSISMAGSAFLAASQEREEFVAEEARETQRIFGEPDEAALDVAELMRGYSVDRNTVEPLLRSLANHPESFLRFLMDFKHHIHKPSFARASTSAAVMGLAYSFAGIIPMIPYFCMSIISHALYVSIALAFVEFSIFGFNNGYQTFGTKMMGLRVAVKTLLVGAYVAACTYGCGRIFNAIIS